MVFELTIKFMVFLKIFHCCFSLIKLIYFADTRLDLFNFLSNKLLLCFKQHAHISTYKKLSKTLQLNFVFLQTPSKDLYFESNNEPFNKK